MIELFCNCVFKAREDEVHKAGFARLTKKYGPEFEVLLAPGVGTFEQYVFSGTFLSASADGRRAAKPVASDLSPAPVHSDQEPIPVDGTAHHARTGKLAKSLRSFHHDCMNKLGDGAAVDYNIPENYPEQKLEAVLQEFAKGNGGSIATFTVADLRP